MISLGPDSLDDKLEIIHQDERYVFANKPSGMLTHRSGDDKHVPACLQSLRRIVKQKVYPVQRLDKVTSGLIGFALSPERTHELQLRLQGDQSEKWYLALVTGRTPESGIIEIPLKDENKNEQLAKTYFEAVAAADLCTLVRVRIFTGRRHQIRRHMARLNHFVIGDPRRGRTDINNIFREKYGLNRLFLHSHRLYLPPSKEFDAPELQLQALLPSELAVILEKLVSDSIFAPEAIRSVVDISK